MEIVDVYKAVNGIIYYTDNKITKGDFIKQNIDTSLWKDIIFIDDFIFNLDSVSHIFPKSKCYKFEIILK